MTTSDDLSYFTRRADEERRRAEAAPQPEVRRVHDEMAARYTALAGAETPAPPRS